MNLLIPYKPIYNHDDPLLDEFTYGDCKWRARKLKSLQKGDVLFFHTTIAGKKYITAYYVVERVLDTGEAVKDKYISSKYCNPHIGEYTQAGRKLDDDVIVFGDPILSRKLEKPLPFDKNLAKKLSLKMPFKDNLSDTQNIGSATRQWRRLTKRDVGILREAIDKNQDTGKRVGRIFSTDEVTEVIEKDLENFIEVSPTILGKELKITKRQCNTPVGRMDLICEDNQGKKIIVELKLNKIGRDAVQQLRRYMHHLKKETKQNVEGILVCKGVMPAFEEELKTLRKIKVFKYGWELKVLPV